jgi:hypothetical protein
MGERPWKEIEPLFREGDPGVHLDPRLVSRVRARLVHRPARRAPTRWALAAVAAASVMSGVALGSAAGRMGLWSAVAAIASVKPQGVRSKSVAPIPPEVDPEATLLRGALSALASGRPEQALEQVDRAVDRFPKGAFAVELELTRARALVALGRDPEALLAFGHLSSGMLPANLTLTWMDLLVRSNRCEEAQKLDHRFGAQALTAEELALRSQLLMRCSVQGPSGSRTSTAH